MVLQKRYCVQYQDGSIDCYGEDGFWYTDKGIIIKWVILVTIFLVFTGWFFGGYIHAKQRLKKGQPLLAYHRFLISYSERRRHGQIPQNHFTFYNQQHPYQAYPQQPYQQRHDGTYAEPPPMYASNDAPPQYFAPAGATKVNANQHGPGMEMPQYGAPPYAAPQGSQQSGVVGSSSRQADVEHGQTQELPPRPQPAKEKLRGFVERFRK